MRSFLFARNPVYDIVELNFPAARSSGLMGRRCSGARFPSVWCQQRASAGFPDASCLGSACLDEPQPRTDLSVCGQQELAFAMSDIQQFAGADVMSANSRAQHAAWNDARPSK